MPAIRQAILNIFIRPPPLRCSHCEKLLVDRPEQKLRSEEHTSELQSLMRISYDVFCLKTKNKKYKEDYETQTNHDNCSTTHKIIKPRSQKTIEMYTKLYT